MQFIRESGISVYLQWEISALIDRLRNVKLKRPLLQGIPAAELEERVSMQIDQRKSYYELADITVDGANLNLEKIIGLIRNRSEWP
jgi:shikimate kinase